MVKKAVVTLALVLVTIGALFAISSYDVEKIIGARLSPGTYKVNVTREKQDLYKVNNMSGDIYVVTKYCYEYSQREDAILEITSSSGYSIGKIHF